MTSSSGDETCKILTLRRLLKYVIVETGEVDVGIVARQEDKALPFGGIGKTVFYLE